MWTVKIIDKSEARFKQRSNIFDRRAMQCNTKYYTRLSDSHVRDLCNPPNSVWVGTYVVHRHTTNKSSDSKHVETSMVVKEVCELKQLKV